MAASRKQEIIQKAKKLNVQFNKCEHCNGTGLIGVVSWINGAGVMDHSWSGEYCNKCEGLGFYIPDDNGVLFLCPTCNGKISQYRYPCEKCGGIGFVDWIENVTRRAVNDWYL